MSQSRFGEVADTIVEAAVNGANLRQACETAGVNYETAQGWVKRGRRDPDGVYGSFVRRLGAAKVGGSNGASSDGPVPEHSDLGPVESRVEALLRDRELHGADALAGAQARTLAKAVDELSTSPGGAAKTALVAASRRLEEVVASLALPREDSLERLQRDMREHRAAQAHRRPSSDRVGRPRRSPAPSSMNGEVDAETVEMPAIVSPRASREW
jgi:hypothetical protein